MERATVAPVDFRVLVHSFSRRMQLLCTRSGMGNGSMWFRTGGRYHEGSDGSSEHGVIEYIRMIYFMPTGHGFQNDFLCMWWHFYSNVSSVRHEIGVDMIMYRPTITADSMQHQTTRAKTTFSYASFRGASRTTSTPPTGWELQFTCTRSPKT